MEVILESIEEKGIHAVALIADEKQIIVDNASRQRNDIEKMLLRKIDLRLLPPLIILYLLAFLDRVNIGNALTLGLTQDLGLQGNQVNVALAVFYVPYIIFELPSNLLLKRFKPHVWLSLTMAAFGIVMLCHGFDYAGIIVLRLFLGLAEAGVFPGSFYLMSMWYRREEAQMRFTFFFQAVTLAGAFGGLLASAIYRMDGLSGYSGWRWIFILEGILTVVLAAVSYFWISDFPEDAKWLTEEERRLVIQRVQEETLTEKQSQTAAKALKSYFSQPKSYVGAVLYFGGVIVGYSLTYFMSTILKGFHYSAVQTQLHSVPPFAAAFFASILTSYASRRTKHRFGFVFAPLLVAIAGAAMLLCIRDNVQVQYAAIFLIVIGTFSAIPIALCWYIMNLEGHHERSIGSAWIVSFGNVGGIVATFTFQAKDAPVYHTGYTIVTLGLSLMAASSTIYLLILMKQNKSRSVTLGKTFVL